MLIAASSERMQMDDYTEISAVVTHPNYLRRGFAQQVMLKTALGIINKGKTPFLHVSENNLGAIRLYEKLGFQFRRKISFWHFALT